MDVLRPFKLLSMGFSTQKYWSGLPFPSPGDLPDPGIEPVSPAWQADSLPLSHLGSPLIQFWMWNVSRRASGQLHLYRHCPSVPRPAKAESPGQEAGILCFNKCSRCFFGSCQAGKHWPIHCCFWLAGVCRILGLSRGVGSGLCGFWLWLDSGCFVLRKSWTLNSRLILKEPGREGSLFKKKKKKPKTKTEGCVLFYLRITLGGIKLKYSPGRLPLYCLSQHVLYDNSDKGCFANLFKSQNQVDSLFFCIRTACGSYSLIRWLRKVTCCDDLEIFLSIIL